MLLDVNNITSYTCKCGMVETIFPGKILHQCSYQTFPVPGQIPTSSSTQNLENKLDTISSNTSSLWMISTTNQKLQELIDILKGE